jgi:NitT/TauT family transport system substrate-binding protein
MVVLLLLLFVTGSGLLAGCGGTVEETQSVAVKLAMGYIPNVQFAPFYVAVERGYFADEGIEIEFDYGWETDLLKLVGSDELQFAIASGDQVVLARGQGLPVVYVMNWYRRFPVCVVSLAETGITTPLDLVGQKVGTPAIYGASYIGWRALLDAVGLAETDMELISIGYTQTAALTEGQVDAAICYAMNEPVQMEAAGEAVDVIYVADYANLVSNGLITNERTVRERPELVQGMVRAALRGIADTLQDPDGAFDISLEYVPEAANDAEAATVNRAILLKSVEFWKADLDKLGHSEEAEWQAAQRIMHQMGLVAAEGNVTDMFTNQFISEANP